MTAINMGIMVSAVGVAITIASGESINMVMGSGPSIGSLIFTRNRYTSGHRLITSHDAYPASVCIFRSIIVGKNPQFAAQSSPSRCPVDAATLYGTAQTCFQYCVKLGALLPDPSDQHKKPDSNL